MLAIVAKMRKKSTKMLKKSKKIEDAWLLFENPVPTDLITDYADFVTKPMSLDTLEENVRAGRYAEPWQFSADAHLIALNARAYNANPAARFPGKGIPESADRLVAYFDKLYDRMLANRVQELMRAGTGAGAVHAGGVRPSSSTHKRPPPTAATSPSQPKKARPSEDTVTVTRVVDVVTQGCMDAEAKGTMIHID